MAYYNEHDPFAAQWLRNLYPGAVVDERSIRDVPAGELVRHDRVHLFGGIGGWELALELAGWPRDRPVWTGSCPCQPYSAAGKGKGDADPRNLWPEMFRLVRECRPDTVIGEQVPGAIGHGWLDGVCRDLEGEGYAVGAVVLGAFSVGAPHKRSRLFWVANNSGTRLEGREEQPSRRERETSERGGDAGGVADANMPSASRLSGVSGEAETSKDRQGWIRTGITGSGVASLVVNSASGGLGADGISSRDGGHASQPDTVGGVGDTEHSRRMLEAVPRCERQDFSSAPGNGWRGEDTWRNYRIIPCRDGKARRISAEPGDEPLAARLPRKLGSELARMGIVERSAVVAAARNRVGRLKGYGNAICPQTAAVFIRAFLESEQHAKA